MFTLSQAHISTERQAEGVAQSVAPSTITGKVNFKFVDISTFLNKIDFLLFSHCMKKQTHKLWRLSWAKHSSVILIICWFPSNS